MSTDYLREALELARQGEGRVSPNPAVGAILVKDGSVVGRGFHTWAGVKHAEVLALEQVEGEDVFPIRRIGNMCDQLRHRYRSRLPGTQPHIHTAM